MKIKHVFNIWNSEMNNLWLRSRLTVIQEKQEASNHTNSGQAKMNFFFSCSSLLASLFYSLYVRSYGINAVYHDLISPKYSLRVSLWRWFRRKTRNLIHRFRMCNEHNALKRSNDHLCVLRPDRRDQHHRSNYYSCKAINAADTSVLTSSLTCGWGSNRQIQESVWELD